MPELTIRDYIELELDKSYRSIIDPMLREIIELVQGSNSAVQRALRELDIHVAELQDGKRYLYLDDATLQGALEIIGRSYEQTGQIVQQYAPQAEESGINIGKASMLAKLAGALTIAMIASGANPLTPQAQGVFTSQFRAANLNITAPDAVEAFIRRTQTDAWRNHMSDWGGGYGNLLERMVTQGLQEGWSPIRTAREIRRYAVDVPQHAAENITRTAQLQAYRDAEAQMERLNAQFIERKIRVSALQAGRTCPTCVALHGTEIPIGEPLKDHHRGLCSSILVPPGGSLPAEMQAMSTPGNRRFVPWQTGDEWFAGLSPAEQRRFMSPSQLKLYNDGNPLSAFVHIHNDAVFGEMPVVAPNWMVEGYESFAAKREVLAGAE